MRGLPVRRIASTALCASLVSFAWGAAAPAAMAADGDAARERTAAAVGAPVPGADALLTQAQSLGDLGTALKPVTDLLADLPSAEGGKLTPAQTTELSTAVKDALAKVREAAPAAPQAPAKSTKAADPVTDALAELQEELDELLDATASGLVGDIVSTATGVVNGLLALVNGVLSGLGLSVPELPELPVDTPAAILPTLS